MNSVAIFLAVVFLAFCFSGTGADKGKDHHENEENELLAVHTSQSNFEGKIGREIIREAETLEAETTTRRMRRTTTTTTEESLPDKPTTRRMRRTTTTTTEESLPDKTTTRRRRTRKTTTNEPEETTTDEPKEKYSQWDNYCDKPRETRPKKPFKNNKGDRCTCDQNQWGFSDCERR